LTTAYLLSVRESDGSDPAEWIELGIYIDDTGLDLALEKAKGAAQDFEREKEAATAGDAFTSDEKYTAWKLDWNPIPSVYDAWQARTDPGDGVFYGYRIDKFTVNAPARDF
jgi:hypothetical protein